MTYYVAIPTVLGINESVDGLFGVFGFNIFGFMIKVTTAIML